MLNNLKLLIISWLFLLIAPGTVQSDADKGPSMKENYASLLTIYNAISGQPERGIQSRKFYLQNFKPAIAPAALQKLTISDLGYLFEANDTVIFHNPDADYIDDMQKILHELESREAIENRHLAALQEAYIASCQFEKAKRMVDQKNVEYLQSVPEIHRLNGLEEGQSTIWVFEGGTLKQRSFSIPKKGPFILVASNPLCGFCRAAAKAISKDVRWSEIFKKHSYWITSGSGKLHTEHFERWSKSYPQLPVALGGVTPPFPEFDSSLVPMFYFFLNGELKKSAPGWSPKKRHPHMDEYLAAIGFK
ncbi:hypothetical protein [Microbulbifer spongiae]|uniref:Uncharacterized protein n=1 Tax=Microbulbifer spongiae TaxID=2944933 RepID=A0ABY9E570_9GAMM|nr:hypothetical protein [Microbulbifer sp. MI-G]WKD48173.1 hypothetical protein M8T91_09445 [Microbulbifer sp. MI-G]